MFGYYKLDDRGNPVECDQEEYYKWDDPEKGFRRVAKTTINGANVSTVFLGLDHGFGEGEPILWETMIFGGPHDGYQDRCTGNITDAVAMHLRGVLVAATR